MRRVDKILLSLTSSKILLLGNKNKWIYFVFRSLNRIIDFVEDTIARE